MNQMNQINQLLNYKLININMNYQFQDIHQIETSVSMEANSSLVSIVTPSHLLSNMHLLHF